MIDIRAIPETPPATPCERTLQSLLDSPLSMIGYWDAAQRNGFASRAYADWFGRDPAEMSGMHVRDLLGEKLYQANLPYIKGVLRGEPQEFERTIPSPDGKGSRHSLAHYVPDVVDGEVRGFFVHVIDISRVKRADEALRSSEARFRMLFEQISDAVAVYDFTSSRFLTANPAACALLGYSLEEFLAIDLAQICDDEPPYTGVEALVRMNAAFASDEPDLVEWRLRDRNGKRLWVEVSLCRAQVDEGAQLLMLARDISNRHAATETLREGEARFRDLFERAPLPYQSLDEAGRIIEVNQTWAQLFGYTRDEALGHSIGEFLTKASRPTLETEFSQLKTTGLSNGVFMDIVRKDGQQRTVELTASTTVDTAGRFVCTHCVLTDVTARDAALAALRDREERLRLFFAHAPIGMMTISHDFHLVDVNDALCRLLGYTAEELKGKYFLDITYADHHAVDLDYVRNLLAGRVANNQVEKRYIHKDGHTIWVRVTRAVIHDDAGNYRYGIGLVEDISAQREADRLRVEHLEQQRDTLVREVHHRIKNNLQGVIGLIEQLQRKHPAAADALEKAAGQISAIAVVHGLHSTTLASEERPHQLVRAIVDAVAQLSSVAIRCHEYANQSGWEWRLNERDIVAVALIINELLYNAIKHTAPGGEIEVTFGRHGTAFSVQVHSQPASLPPGFNFAAGRNLGTGLSLVAALLPRQGASLSFDQQGGAVKAHLKLTHPCAMATPVGNDDKENKV